MIKLCSSTDKIYNSNGDKVITPLKAKEHKEDNGVFYLDVECPISYSNYLQANNIIVTNTPQGNQAFRINNPEFTRTKITLKDNHVFFDTQNYLISDSYVVDKNCNDALDYLNSATETPSPFTTLSNINTINSFRCVRKSLYEAIETILDRWGGHLVRDNYNIKILDKIGNDNGIMIRYGKNLESTTCKYKESFGIIYLHDKEVVLTMINWKVRFKNKNFWLAMIPACIVLVQAIGKVFGLEINLNDLGDSLIGVVNALFVVLAILGIVVDPTTKGVGDSTRSLAYTEPSDGSQDEYKEVDDTETVG